jgi:uncharacterized LabA/DUF88 family protein
MLTPAGEAPAIAPATEQSSEADDESFEAHVETVTQAEVNQALHEVDTANQTAPRPRRYRFDRPAPAAASSLRPERLRATPASAPIALPGAPESESPEAPLADTLVHSPDAPSASPDAEQALAPLATEGAEAEAADASEFEAAGAPDAAESEEGGEAPSSRRRRRRRRGSGNGTGIRHLEAVIAPDGAVPEPTPIAARLSGHPATTDLPYERPLAPYAPTPEELGGADDQTGASAYAAPGQPFQMYGPEQPEPWNVANAYQQMRQPQSPFGAPEPTSARGFGPAPRGAAPERSGRGARSERAADAPPIAPNQLGALVTQALQSQTDRLLTELRHTQAPPSMTVMFPPFPSTERVGVFVDVANLLYSSRNMRLSIDFGRLLEFLRGNRRLVRAQAYAPTSPEPHAEQQFLSVVKGVGYRITTKNYKTFSSGAKKADLDLDLCMDIVRLVEARALDTIVLVSGDSDFLPLLEYCSDHGVRVEVAAFDDSASTVLRQSCDLFINLSLVEDIRA